jgi:hypothetical protein
MKRLFFVTVCLLMFITMPAMASSSKYADANRQTIWNNLTDGVNTLGQSSAQAAKTKKHLHAVRRQNRLKSANTAKQ